MTRPPARLLVLVLIAAASRLALQAIVMPPYAGLDEIFHAGMLAFRAQEARMPTSSERSMPPYIVRTLINEPDALPTFGQLGAKWPEIVRTRSEIVFDRPLRADELRPYVVKNYEAQQPSLYYAIAGPFARWIPQRSAVRELLVWRALSVLFSLITVFAAALIGWRCAGNVGLLAAALLPSLPTWLTLVVRASNDALACALLALAVAQTLLSVSRDGTDKSVCATWLEGLAWMGAMAAKLYAWPVWILVPIALRSQRASRTRWLVVVGCSVAGVALTMADLASRTGNPLGLFAFDAPTATHAPVAIDYPLMLRIFVLTGTWTSGQHWNSLTPLAIKLLFIPLFAVLALSLSAWRTHRVWLLTMLAVIVAFAGAQLVNVAGYMRIARATGLPLPPGGKEGWYWYALAPLFLGILFSLGLKTLSRAWPLLLAVVAWLIGWDVLIHEGALFQDFAGLTSPQHSSALFAWAPVAMPFSRAVAAGLAHVALTKWVSIAPLLRAIHVIAVVLLLVNSVRCARSSSRLSSS